MNKKKIILKIYLILNYKKYSNFFYLKLFFYFNKIKYFFTILVIIFL